MTKKQAVFLISVLFITAVAAILLNQFSKSEISADTASNATNYLRYADLDQDGAIGNKDFLVFSACWHKYNEGGSLTDCRQADLNYDLSIDGYDFAHFVYYWRKSGGKIDSDFNKDAKVSDLDFVILKQCWTDYNKEKAITAGCSAVDADKNGKIDALDFSTFAAIWRYSGRVRAGDINNDKAVNATDYSRFKDCWARFNSTGKITGNNCKKADIDGNQQINSLDFSQMATSWRIYENPDIK